MNVMDFGILKEHYIDVETGVEYCGDELRYASMVQRFYRAYDRNRMKLLRSSEEGDTQGFTIAIHALKGNARMIGASSFARTAEWFESLGRDGKIDTIREKLSDLMDEYMGLMEVIKPYGEAQLVHIPGEMSEDEAREIGEELLKALEDCDSDKAGALLQELVKFPFRVTIKRKLKEAGEDISGYQFDEAAELVKRAIDSIDE